MKPLSEKELREKLYTLADLDCDTAQGINACGYDNWYCTYHSSLLNKMADLVLSDRKAWGNQERARELGMLLKAEYIKPDCYDTVVIAKEALERQRNQGEKTDE